ncbi:MAG: hypothetical protein IJO26_02010 [Clostridium sp.]|nr:hypothetical protein [Clostridium sp.]
MNKDESKESIELKNINKEIQRWYNNQSKILNIITTPYNTNKIFLEIVKIIIKENKKVIYVCNSEEIFKTFFRDLKKFLKKDNTIENYLNKERSLLDNICYKDFKEAKYGRENYELCIVDDITSFSNSSKEEIRSIIENVYIYSKRIIAYSIEKTINMGITLQIDDLVNQNIFVEPRIINTRINLNEDIPEILYDYLIWFKNKNSKVIIYLPTDEKVNNIYNYFTNTLIIEDVNVIKLTKSENLKDIERRYLQKNKSVFVITNIMKNYSIKDTNVNIIVLFAEDNFFNYKKIIYLCGEVSKRKVEDDYQREVVLVSKDTSKDMDKAKDIARRYNKNKWQNGLMKY